MQPLIRLVAPLINPCYISDNERNKSADIKITREGTLQYVAYVDSLTDRLAGRIETAENLTDIMEAVSRISDDMVKLGEPETPNTSKPAVNRIKSKVINKLGYHSSIKIATIMGYDSLRATKEKLIEDCTGQKELSKRNERILLEEKPTPRMGDDWDYDKPYKIYPNSYYTAYPGLFRQRFGSVDITINPIVYAEEKNSRLLYVTVDNGLGVDDYRVIEAIKEVLESNEIRQYGEVKAPDFDQREDFHVVSNNRKEYAFTIQANPDDTQRIALAKLIETRLLEKLEEAYPPKVWPDEMEGYQPKIYTYPESFRGKVTQVIREPYQPYRMSDVDMSILEPYADHSEILIPFTAKNGRQFYLTELDRERTDLEFLYSLANSRTDTGMPYHTPFVFSVLNAQIHKGEPQVVSLSLDHAEEVDKPRIEWVKQKFNALFDVENYARRHDGKPPFVNLKAYFREKHGLTYYEEKEELILEDGKAVPIPLNVANYFYKDAFEQKMARPRTDIILAIRDDTGRPVGTTELLPVGQLFGDKTKAAPSDKVEKGCGSLVRPELQGLGIAPRAMLALIKYGRDHLGVVRIRSGADPENFASMKMQYNRGMRPEREENGKLKIYWDGIYTDDEGKVRPRVKTVAEMEDINDLLDNPDLLENLERKKKIDAEFRAYQDELGEALGTQSIKGTYTARLKERNTQQQRTP